MGPFYLFFLLSLSLSFRRPPQQLKEKDSENLCRMKQWSVLRVRLPVPPLSTPFWLPLLQWDAGQRRKGRRRHSVRFYRSRLVVAFSCALCDVATPRSASATGVTSSSIIFKRSFYTLIIHVQLPSYTSSRYRECNNEKEAG